MALFAAKRVKYRGQFHAPGEEFNKPTMLYKTGKDGRPLTRQTKDANGNTVVEYAPKEATTTAPPTRAERRELLDSGRAYEQASTEEIEAAERYQAKLDAARDEVDRLEGELEAAEKDADKKKLQSQLDAAKKKLAELE